jgi:uncharacterized membrane protein YeaQ/YmgE (transglycosylase-associated protein family)
VRRDDEKAGLGKLSAATLAEAVRSLRRQHTDRDRIMSIIWTIIIGFVAGLIAKWIMPGRNEPSGFIMTTILGIVGAVIATYLGQALGWYRADEGAGFIGAIVGAVVVLFIYGLIAGRRSTSSY